MTDAKRVTRRRQSAEVKARVLAECDEPGASVAQVAMATGSTPTWCTNGAAMQRANCWEPAAFVPVSVHESIAAPPTGIRIEFRHGATSMAVTPNGSLLS